MKKNELTGRERLLTVHGNRFIAHCVLQRLVKDERFSRCAIDTNDLQRRSATIVDELIPSVTLAMNELFADSYPANVFKNATKCKSILEKIDTNVE